MSGNSIHVLWVVDIIAECATAAVMYRRRALSSFPAFFSLLIFLCAKSLILAALSILKLTTAYFYAYWAGSAVRTIFLGGVLGELARAILKPAGWLPAHFSRICMVVSSMILVIAVFSSWHSGSLHSDDLPGLARHANEIVSWTFLVLLAALFVLSGLVEVSWNFRLAGITVGLLVELWGGSLAAVVADLFGRAGVDAANWVRLSAFVITNCIWIVTFLLPWAEPPLQRGLFSLCAGDSGVIADDEAHQSLASNDDCC